MKRSLTEIVAMIEADLNDSQFGDVITNGASIDTRQIEKGNLFIPFKGEQTDGHLYVRAAIDKGAAASFWQKDVPNPPQDIPLILVDDTLSAMQALAKAYRSQLNVKVIGITGSNGKTTTKDIAASVFGEAYRVHKTDGNFNNHIGLPLTILKMPETAEIAILEMGMSGKGEIATLTNIAKPDIAIITNIGEAHLLDLGSREAIAEAKLEIAEGLPQGGLLIYPGYEPLLVKRVSMLKTLHLKTFGETPEYDAYAVDVRIDDAGSTFTVPAFHAEPFHLPISGKHNVLNALSVLLAAKNCNIPNDLLKEGLKSVKLSSMRMEWRDGAHGTKILNDAYNASPTAMKAVINLVESMSGEREKIVVLGDMLELGADEVRYHLEIGEGLDANQLKYVFTYGPLGKYIAEGATAKFGEQRVFAFTDQEELIQALKEKIVGGELILVKASRGMKLEAVADALSGR